MRRSAGYSSFPSRELCNPQSRRTGITCRRRALTAVDLNKFYAGSIDDQIEGANPFLRYRTRGSWTNLGAALVYRAREFSALQSSRQRDDGIRPAAGRTWQAALPRRHGGSRQQRDNQSVGAREPSTQDGRYRACCPVASIHSSGACRDFGSAWTQIAPNSSPDERGGPAGKLY